MPQQDAIALLKADHKKVKALLEQLEKTTERGAARRTKLLGQIDKELKVHTEIEETIFYPAFRDAVQKKEDREMYFEALEEHHVVKLVLPEIQETDPASEPFAAKAKVLKELVEHHAGEEEKYTLVLANPPFAGSLDYENTAKDLLQIVKTKKTELLFLALFLKLLRTGGRAAVIVPDGVLFGSSKAHRDLRKILVEDQKLDAVVKLPSGVFKPYAGVSTAILLFTKTNSGGTDEVWFYDVQADGFSLDDKRNPVEANDLPDVLTRWFGRTTTERDRPRTAKSFTIPKPDIVAQNYDLSLNRYKEIVPDDVKRRSPREIIADVESLEVEISKGLNELKMKLS